MPEGARARLGEDVFVESTREGVRIYIQKDGFEVHNVYLAGYQLAALKRFCDKEGIQIF